MAGRLGETFAVAGRLGEQSGSPRQVGFLNNQVRRGVAGRFGETFAGAGRLRRGRYPKVKFDL